ncbi:MAG: ATP-binding cassette domain-containing protein, partial [Negativicutes bacterium]|nr:ATP-binding cassette domain-containing protein [Negativicutes bacterium]
MTCKIEAQKLNLYYGNSLALKEISLKVEKNSVLALIGPSGCGKSTFIKSINRMNDLVDNVKIEGEILIDGVNIYHPDTDVVMLRKKVGMVFQRPNPFPMSIYDNIAYGPRIHGISDKKVLDEIVERSLTGAALWSEVKDRLKASAMGMSGGQQQR